VFPNETTVCVDCADDEVALARSTSPAHCIKTTQSFPINNSAVSVFAFWQWPRKHLIQIEKGTFSNNTVLSVKMVWDLSIFPANPKLATTDILKFDIQGSTTFFKPIKITMGFTDQPPDTTVVFQTFDERLREWVVPDFVVSVDASDHTASVSVTHFSFWRIDFQSNPTDESTTADPVAKDTSRKADSFIQIFDVLMLFLLFTLFMVVAVLMAHRDNSSTTNQDNCCMSRA